MLPLVMMLGLGTVGVGRLIRTQMAISAVAREAARAAALAPLPPGGSADGARRAGETRGQEVADGYGLGAAHISVNAEGFNPGSWIRADTSYDVSERDLPLPRWTSFRLHASQLERVDPYRSRSP